MSRVSLAAYEALNDEQQDLVHRLLNDAYAVLHEAGYSPPRDDRATEFTEACATLVARSFVPPDAALAGDTP